MQLPERLQHDGVPDLRSDGDGFLCTGDAPGSGEGDPGGGEDLARGVVVLLPFERRRRLRQLGHVQERLRRSPCEPGRDADGGLHLPVDGHAVLAQRLGPGPERQYIV